MTFIVTLIALLIERFFDWSHLRNWRWLSLYQNKIVRSISGKSSYLVLALTILPWLIIVAVIDFFLNNLLYGFARLLFDLFILLYCLGPRDLWADAFSCINALTQGDAQYAADKLKMLFGVTEISNLQSLHRNLLYNIFIEANRRVFAVVFWYVILGPIGAILYRLISLVATDVNKQDEKTDLVRSARLLESILDWAPIRALSIIFALGGHFVQVLGCWRKKASYQLSNNESFLTECGVAALGIEEKSKIPEDGSAEKGAISLLDRSFIIFLVVVAITVFLV